MFFFQLVALANGVIEGVPKMLTEADVTLFFFKLKTKFRPSSRGGELNFHKFSQ